MAHGKGPLLGGPPAPRKQTPPPPPGPEDEGDAAEAMASAGELANADKNKKRDAEDSPAPESDEDDTDEDEDEDAKHTPAKGSGAAGPSNAIVAQQRSVRLPQLIKNTLNKEKAEAERKLSECASDLEAAKTMWPKIINDPMQFSAAEQALFSKLYTILEIDSEVALLRVTAIENIIVGATPLTIRDGRRVDDEQINLVEIEDGERARDPSYRPRGGGSSAKKSSSAKKQKVIEPEAFEAFFNKALQIAGEYEIVIKLTADAKLSSSQRCNKVWNRVKDFVICSACGKAEKDQKNPGKCYYKLLTFTRMILKEINDSIEGMATKAPPRLIVSNDPVARTLVASWMGE